MRILGIDPGLRSTGFGIIDIRSDYPYYVNSGTIRTHSLSQSLSERLLEIYLGIEDIVQEHNPQIAVIEQIFVSMNGQSTLKLGQARGACLCALMRTSKMPIFEYSALVIKKSIAGHGHAAKIQVREMVRRLLSLSELPGNDSADALAVALTHAQHIHLQRAISNSL
ncbi:MAG: crossover junction endodeoxyribonuclease RuvC [Gammaproteobacteria bacterium]|nr:crossover junction endodeoxyribonuclease RuvC [Gammaproteobacteria bacterium]